MSEGEVTALRGDIARLSTKQDEGAAKQAEQMARMVEIRETQHADNRREREADRRAFELAIASQNRAFAEAMSQQRDQFQEAINKQFLEYVSLDKKVDRVDTVLRLSCGDGGATTWGKLGEVATSVEVLKQFRWQTLAIVALLLLIADKVGPYLVRH